MNSPAVAASNVNTPIPGVVQNGGQNTSGAATPNLASAGEAADGASAIGSATARVVANGAAAATNPNGAAGSDVSVISFATAPGAVPGGSPMPFDSSVQVPAGSANSNPAAGSASSDGGGRGLERPHAAISREVVSPKDVIFAIREGNLAIKTDGAEGSVSDRALWLFDDESGGFVAPSPEPLTITVDHDGDGVATLDSDDYVAAPSDGAFVVPDQSWLGMLRRMRTGAVSGWWSR